MALERPEDRPSVRVIFDRPRRTRRIKRTRETSRHRSGRNMIYRRAGHSTPRYCSPVRLLLRPPLPGPVSPVKRSATSTPSWRERPARLVAATFPSTPLAVHPDRGDPFRPSGQDGATRPKSGPPAIRPGPGGCHLGSVRAWPRFGHGAVVLRPVFRPAVPGCVGHWS